MTRLLVVLSVAAISIFAASVAVGLLGAHLAGSAGGAIGMSGTALVLSCACLYAFARWHDRHERLDPPSAGKD